MAFLFYAMSASYLSFGLLHWVWEAGSSGNHYNSCKSPYLRQRFLRVTLIYPRIQKISKIQNFCSSPYGHGWNFRPLPWYAFRFLPPFLPKFKDTPWYNNIVVSIWGGSSYFFLIQLRTLHFFGSCIEIITLMLINMKSSAM